MFKRSISRGSSLSLSGAPRIRVVYGKETSTASRSNSEALPFERRVMHFSINEQHLLLLRSYEQTELRLMNWDWEMHRNDKPYTSFDLAIVSSSTGRPPTSRILLEGPINRAWSTFLH